jgi:DnaD/phage-associated family protein
MAFKGFPSGKVRFTNIPEPFFSELLPHIDHLGELKLTLYALWRLDRMAGEFRYLQEVDFLEDDLFMGGMGEDHPDAQQALGEALDRAVARGTFLKAAVEQMGRQITLYFLNTPRGRAAVESIQAGEWRPTGDPRTPVELAPERPSIYHLYEKNIGPLTPMIAESLQDAEDTYPQDWIEEAIRIAVERNARNWRYVAAILKRWQEQGKDERRTRRDTEASRRRYAEWESD